MNAINSYYCKACKKDIHGEQQKNHHIHTNKHELKCLLEYNKKNPVFNDIFNKNKSSMDCFIYNIQNRLICRHCLVGVHPNKRLNHLRTMEHKISVCCLYDMDNNIDVVHHFFIEKM